MPHVQCVLQSVAYRVMACMLKLKRKNPVKRRTSTVTENGVAVTITVCAAGEAECQPYPGRWFSDAEALVWQAIKPGERLVGKEIAARCGKKYDDPRFKAMLMNLVDREILHNDDDGKGYARAIAPPPGAANADVSAG